MNQSLSTAIPLAKHLSNGNNCNNLVCEYGFSTHTHSRYQLALVASKATKSDPIKCLRSADKFEDGASPRGSPKSNYLPR